MATELKNNVLKIKKETDLGELCNLIRHDRRTGKIKKDVVSNRALCMLGRLYYKNEPADLVPRQIHTIGELYSFTEKEILRCRGYKKKTWAKLSELLIGYGLPSLKPSQDYTIGR